MASDGSSPLSLDGRTGTGGAGAAGPGKAPGETARPATRRRSPGLAVTTSPEWLYHHLTISGPTDGIAGFAAAAPRRRDHPLATGFRRPRGGYFYSRHRPAGRAKEFDGGGLPHPGAAIPRTDGSASGARGGAARAQPGLPVRSAHPAAGANRHSPAGPHPSRGKNLAGGALGRHRPAAAGGRAAKPGLPRLFFTDAGLAELRRMMADRRLADPKKFAHVRQELGLD